ncbi:hypothetical protein GIB67_040419 [Kingdonia uniflora]|uniref:Reverse transcriptase zinc-binding domain-containing protein n=1 Tax=Kingdonia uniflora TaxID=39325 RepID=A0A7J7KXP2_9MAGN|nr:hypothetical protein GIB67_040419 [Kingdonia uniflora]
MLMKLGWAFLNDQDPWAIFLRAKFQNKEGLLIQYYKNTSIWTGLKEALVSVKASSKWIIGSGKDIDFWRDCWGFDIAIIGLLDILADIWKHCTTKLSQIIHQNSWSAPSEVVDLLASLGINLSNIILNNSDMDIRVWKHSPHGLFLVQSAFHHSSSHNPKVLWYHFTNSKVILPRIASFTWKVYHNALATEDLLIQRGLNLVSRCSFCRCNLETMKHLFWTYPMSSTIWILAAIKNTTTLSCNSMANTCFELSIVAALGVPTRARPLPRIQSCTWALPWFQEVKLNCRAAVTGSPEKPGIGAVVRNNLGDVLGVLTQEIGTYGIRDIQKTTKKPITLGEAYKALEHCPKWSQIKNIGHHVRNVARKSIFNYSSGTSDTNPSIPTFGTPNVIILDDYIDLDALLYACGGVRPDGKKKYKAKEGAKLSISFWGKKIFETMTNMMAAWNVRDEQKKKEKEARARAREEQKLARETEIQKNCEVELTGKKAIEDVYLVKVMTTDPSNRLPTQRRWIKKKIKLYLKKLKV